jgi:hypothetical protein
MSNPGISSQVLKGKSPGTARSSPQRSQYCTIVVLLKYLGHVVPGDFPFSSPGIFAGDAISPAHPSRPSQYCAALASRCILLAHDLGLSASPRIPILAIFAACGSAAGHARLGRDRSLRARPRTRAARGEHQRPHRVPARLAAVEARSRGEDSAPARGAARTPSIRRRWRLWRAA